MNFVTDNNVKVNIKSKGAKIIYDRTKPDYRVKELSELAVVSVIVAFLFHYITYYLAHGFGPGPVQNAYLML